jgi:hypothetical protein
MVVPWVSSSSIAATQLAGALQVITGPATVCVVQQSSAWSVLTSVHQLWLLQ